MLRALFLVLFIVALGDTIVNAAAAAARAAYHARELSALRQGLAAGVALAQQRAAGSSAPLVSSTCAYGSASSCAMTVETSVAVAAAPSPSAAPCAAGRCIVVLQDNSAIAEGRERFSIATRVLAPNGDLLGARSIAVSFRTFAQAPYASLVGSLDATLAAALASGPGDDGGNAAGTLIHVRYAGAGGNVSGDVWRALDEGGTSQTAAWNP